MVPRSEHPVTANQIAEVCQQTVLRFDTGTQIYVAHAAGVRIRRAGGRNDRPGDIP